MDIQHSESSSKGSFFMDEEGETRSELTYSKAGESLIIIDHTEVAESLRGQDVGKRLVQHAVQYARDKKLKVIPLCPFAKSVIEADESLQDVLR